MDYIKNIIILSFLLAVFSCQTNKRTESSDHKKLIDYVDPFIGTDFHGHTFPGATTPFGMVQLSPDNPVSGWDWSSGYHYSSDTIAGFSHTHLSGTGVGDLLDISVLPIVGFDAGQAFSPSNFYTGYTHDNEEASPGYYAVKLGNGVNVELTATTRTGFHKYAFPANEAASLMFDLGFYQNNDSPYSTAIEKVDGNTVLGHRHSNGWAKDQKLYFYAEFSVPVKSYKLYDENNNAVEGNDAGSENVKGKGVKAVFSFGKLSGPLQVKVGISSSGTEGAKNNLQAETEGKSFEAIKAEAEESWEKVLGKIEVESRSESQLRVFYTAMYHAHIAPNTYSDVDGHYTGIDGRQHQNKKAANYYTFSLWDTYRASHPLFTILEPQKVTGFMEAFLMQYNESGLLPVWSLWGNETNCMIGYHAIPVIVDAYFKGLVKDGSAGPLFEAMLSSANQSIRETQEFIKYGYIPCDLAGNSVSKSLEYAYDDWCIAQMAKALGKNDVYAEFTKRARGYRHLYNKGSKLMQPKRKDGSWKEFDPFDTGYKNDYTEANAFQYTWYVPHDVPGLMDLMGGANEFEAMLDSIFNMEPEVGEEAALDVSGFIGQYVHGNEPSHHIAYLFNYAGSPYKTQEKVSRIMEEMYSDQPDGLCGNEDCGQMSSWYVFSAMGMYPVNPATGKYDIGKPAFPYMKVSAGTRPFEIFAHNISDKNIYIQKIVLNGTEHSNGHILHKDILKGGKLEFYMGPKPNKNLKFKY